ncbi:hypothetical protein HPP92_029019 [Vanilla planifolia]|uniref:Uncharacterized protein n=1 Tax=Vanilla planifolia TaxID=51239 RepID=A0A835U363_VANPL|nr:hypothetical protein HPP92_029007 [Vanilla planifolia]KAG0446087.1 hypothetical protein HPP92_029019 [Vanilla planifolia]
MAITETGTQCHNGSCVCPDIETDIALISKSFAAVTDDVLLVIALSEGSLRSIDIGPDPECITPAEASGGQTSRSLFSIVGFLESGTGSLTVVPLSGRSKGIVGQGQKLMKEVKGLYAKHSVMARHPALSSFVTTTPLRSHVLLRTSLRQQFSLIAKSIRGDMFFGLNTWDLLCVFL